MARINDNVLRNWNNGETMTEALYEQEREILRIAVNDTDDKVEGLKPRVTTLESDNTSNKNRITAVETLSSENKARIDAIDSDIGDFSMEELRETNARIETFYLNNDNNMRPVTFGDLKNKNVTYDTLKYGYVRFHLFRFWRFEGGNV